MNTKTRTDLENRLTFLQSKGFDIWYDRNYPGYRFTNRSGSRDLYRGPRLTLREAHIYLDGFMQCYDLIAEKVINVTLPKHIVTLQNENH